MKPICLIFLWALVACYVQTLLAEKLAPITKTQCSIQERDEPSGNIKYHVVTTVTRSDGTRQTQEFAQADSEDRAFKFCKEFQKIVAKSQQVR